MNFILEKNMKAVSSFKKEDLGPNKNGLNSHIKKLVRLETTDWAQKLLLQIFEFWTSFPKKLKCFLNLGFLHQFKVAESDKHRRFWVNFPKIKTNYWTESICESIHEENISLVRLDYFIRGKFPHRRAPDSIQWPFQK